MRYKPYFVNRHKPNWGFLKKKKRHPRKKRLRLKLGKLKAKRIKPQDSSIKKTLCLLLIFSTALSFIFPLAFYLVIAILGICFLLTCCKALFYKEEKQYSVMTKADSNN